MIELTCQQNSTSSDRVLEESNLFLKVLSGFLIVITTGSFFILGVVFLKKKNSSRFLSSRANFLTYIAVIGSVLQISWAIDSLMDRSGFPCLIISNLLLLMVILQIVPRMIATVQVYFKIMLNKQMAKFELVSAVHLRGYDKLIPVDSKNGIEHDPLGGEEYSKSWCCWVFLGGCCWDLAFGRSRREKIVRETLLISMKLPGAAHPEEIALALKQFPPEYVFLFSSNRFAILMQLLAIVFAIIYILCRNGEEAFCTSPCDTELKLLPEVLVSTSIVTAVGSYYLFQIRNEPDPFKSVRELRISCWMNFIFGLGSGTLISIDPGNAEAGGDFRWAFFWVLASCFTIILCLGYPLHLVTLHEKNRNHHRDSISLSKVLGFEAGRDRFKAFLVAELSVENYLFWSSATKYKEGFDDRAPPENKTLRRLIMNMYVMEDAAMSVNISGFARRSVHDSMKKDPDPQDFDRAVVDVLQNMESDSFMRFRSTSEFRRLFSEEEDEIL